MSSGRLGHAWLSSALLEAVKEARSSPSTVAARLAKRLPRFEKNDYRDPRRSNCVIVKKEGKTAISEAISFLSRQAPLDFDITVTQHGIGLAAADHVIDIGNSGAVEHTGRDLSSPSVRLERYGRWLLANGEVLWFGKLFARESSSADELREQARIIVEDLIIDDGVLDRGHRLCIYSDKFNVGGAAVSSHVVFGHCVAIEFAGGWEEGNEGAGDYTADRSARLTSISLGGSSGGMREPRTQWSVELGDCVACARPILGGTVVTADKLGGKLHEACFVCGCCGDCDLKATECCGRSLQGVTFNLVKGGAAVCRGCWEKSHSPMCNFCSRPIVDGRVARDKGGSEDFHPDCWTQRRRAHAASAAGAAVTRVSRWGRHSDGPSHDTSDAALSALSSTGRNFDGLVATGRNSNTIVAKKPGPSNTKSVAPKVRTRETGNSRTQKAIPL